MKALLTLGLVILVCIFCMPAIAGEDDSVTAVFIFGRTGGWMASGFAVGDGSYVVTSSDAVKETVYGKKVLVPTAVVVSRWTGDAYTAKILSVDDQQKLALLKIEKQGIPGVAIAADAALSRVKKATSGQVFSGEECGDRFPARLYAMDAQKSPHKYIVKKWDSSQACISEIWKQNWLFLSKTDPPEKAPKAALVVKPGLGAIGVYYGRVIVDGGPKPITFYRVLPASGLRDFLRKGGVSELTLSTPQSASSKASDAEESFQSACQALYASMSTTPSTVADSTIAALKLRPDSAVLNMLSGTVLTSQGKFDDAIKAMNKALELDPSIANGRFTRGVALAAAGKTSDAEQDLRKAILDKPKDPRPVLALVNLLMGNTKTVEEAAKLAKDAAKEWPDDLDVRMINARMMKRSKDYDGAIAELRAVLQIAPKLGIARVALGSTYEAAGRLDDAEAEYRKLIEAEPVNVDAHITLIEFLISAGKMDVARKEIDIVNKLKLQPDAVEAVKKLEVRISGDTKKK